MGWPVVFWGFLSPIAMGSFLIGHTPFGTVGSGRNCGWPDGALALDKRILAELGCFVV
jgi:hypothetical protein